jgi:hypothetical protein
VSENWWDELYREWADGEWWDRAIREWTRDTGGTESIEEREDRGFISIAEAAAGVNYRYLLQHAKSRAEWRRLYEEYLVSPQWQTRRQHVLDRCSGICEGCRERPAMQVHHKNYDHVGEELLFDLVALCDECHLRTHY